MIMIMIMAMPGIAMPTAGFLQPIFLGYAEVHLCQRVQQWF
jgi:hypothetical protein